MRRMAAKRIAAVLFLSLLLAASAFAQDATAPVDSEFGRASGGAVDLMTKGAKPISGTLGLSLGSSSTHGYGLTLGGTLVPDRVWFFAAGERRTSLLSSQYGVSRADVPAFDAKMIGQIGDRQNLAASFSDTKQPTWTAGTTLPTSFLSLHYTGIVTDNMFFTASFSQLRSSN